MEPLDHAAGFNVVKALAEYHNAVGHVAAGNGPAALTIAVGAIWRQTRSVEEDVAMVKVLIGTTAVARAAGLCAGRTMARELALGMVEAR